MKLRVKKQDASQSELLDVALSEYIRRRREQGEIAATSFAAQFPAIESALIQSIKFFELVEARPNIAQFLENLVWPSCGDHLDPFVIDREIGAGAFARVYLANDLSLGGRQVVLKFYAANSNETHILGQLKHPNIVSPLSVHSFHEWNLVALAMPYLGVATLSHLISFVRANPKRRHRVCIDDFANTYDGYKNHGVMGMHGEVCANTLCQKITADIAEALSYAHANGFIHSDVKPENILLANDGTAKLLDFNLAVSSSTESIRLIGGTRQFMAPEHVQALSEEHGITVDASVDVYSLAASMVALLDEDTSQLQSPKTFTSSFWQPAEFATRYKRTFFGRRLKRLLQDCISTEPENRPSTHVIAKTLSRQNTILSRLMVSLVLFSALSLSIGTSLRTTDEQRLAKGWAALTVEDTPELATDMFSVILSHDQSRDDIRLLRACASIESDDLFQANNDLRKITSLSQSEKSALLGYVYSAFNRNFNVAQLELDRAYSDGIHRLDVLNNLGVCEERLAHLELAQRLFYEARQIEPLNYTVLFNSVQVEFRLAEQNFDYQIDIPLVNSFITCRDALADGEAVLLASKCCLMASRQNNMYSQSGLELAQRAYELGISKHRIQELLEMSPDGIMQIQHITPDVNETTKRVADPLPMQPNRLIKPPTSSKEFLQSLLDKLA